MQDKPPLSYGVGFRSLAREIPEPVALTVSGALPSWLKGTLLPHRALQIRSRRL